jgi:hypothetical protein
MTRRRVGLRIPRIRCGTIPGQPLMLYARGPQLNRRLAGLQTHATATEAALDWVATALLMVNAVGRVMRMDTAADALRTGIRTVEQDLTTALGLRGHGLRDLSPTT